MIDALLADEGLRAAVDDVHPAGEYAETIGRIAWSVLAEPGDGVAGALVGELGAAEALRFVFGDTQALVPPGG